MDPNETYNRMMKLAKEIDAENQKHGVLGLDMSVGPMLAEYVIELDEWIRKGAALPKAWERVSDRK